MKYRVLDGLDLDNRAYVAGDTVAIDDDAIAAVLVDAGVIEASEAPPRQGKQSDAVHRRATKSPGEGGKAAVEGNAAAQADENGDPDRAVRLIAAIGELASDNSEHWTTSGKPRTEALEAVSGLENVSAAERDAAFEAYLSGKEGDASGEPDGE